MYTCPDFATIPCMVDITQNIPGVFGIRFSFLTVGESKADRRCCDHHGTQQSCPVQIYSDLWTIFELDLVPGGEIGHLKHVFLHSAKHAKKSLEKKHAVCIAAICHDRNGNVVSTEKTWLFVAWSMSQRVNGVTNRRLLKVGAKEDELELVGLLAIFAYVKCARPPLR